MLFSNAAAYIFKSSLCLTLLTDMVPASVIGQWLVTLHTDTIFALLIFGPSNPAPPSAWRLWASALRLCFGLHNGLSLPSHYRLGKWISTSTPWQYDPSTQRIYRQQSNGWYYHSRIPSSRQARYPRFHPEPHPGIPSQSYNCTVLQCGDSLLLTGYMESAPPPPEKSSTTLSNFLANLPKEAQWALQDLSYTGSLEHLLLSLSRGQAISASDGSYADNWGTTAWILSDQNNSISGLCSVPGAPRFHNSYRSELGGLYGILLVVWAIEQVHPLLAIRLSIYCDGLEAIRKSSLPLRWARGSPTQYDLLGAIWHLRRLLRCQPSFCHVKGHQDAPYSQLDFPSQLNHHMDSRAKAFLRRKPSAPLPSIFMEPWTAYISGEKISGSLQLSLREHCTASDLLTWWSTKQRPQATSFHQIDWDALQKAMTSLKLTRRHWIANHAAGICGVGTVLQRWKWQDHSTCP